MRRQRLIASLLVLCATSMALVGCAGTVGTSSTVIPNATAVPAASTTPSGADSPQASATPQAQPSGSGGPRVIQQHADAPQLPTLPSATNLKTVDSQSPQGTNRDVTFQTPETAVQVLNWYSTTLSAANWQFQYGPGQPDFVIHGGCPNYGLHIDATPNADGTTHVDLKMRPLLCA